MSPSLKARSIKSSALFLEPRPMIPSAGRRSSLSCPDVTNKMGDLVLKVGVNPTRSLPLYPSTYPEAYYSQ